MSDQTQPSPGDALTTQQLQVIAGLSAGLTIAEMSLSAGVSRQTIYNWQKEPKFLNALNAGRQRYADELRDYLLILSRKALKRIETIIEDPKTPPGVALKAALAILNRPQPPEQGWNLPANINTPRQEHIQQTQVALDLEMKQAEIEDLKRKQMMATIRIGQNLTPSQPSPQNPAPQPRGVSFSLQEA